MARVDLKTWVPIGGSALAGIVLAVIWLMTALGGKALASDVSALERRIGRMEGKLDLTLTWLNVMAHHQGIALPPAPPDKE